MDVRSMSNERDIEWIFGNLASSLKAAMIVNLLFKKKCIKRNKSSLDRPLLVFK